MRKLLILLTAASSLAPFAFACASAEPSSSSTTGESALEEAALHVIPAREWVRCWTKPSATAGETALLCQSTDVAGYPFAIDAINVSIAQHNDADIVSNGRAERSAVEVDTLEAGDFPITVTVKVTVGLDDSNDGSGLSGKDLTAKFVLASPESGAIPKVFRQPFDLWPIAVAEKDDPNRPDDFSNLTLTSYTAPLGEFTLSFGATQVSANLPTSGDSLETTYFVAPTAGVIHGQHGRYALPNTPPRSQQDIDIRQPGVFVMGPGGFRPATSDDKVKLPKGFPFVPAGGAGVDAGAEGDGANATAEAGSAIDGAASDGDAGSP